MISAQVSIESDGNVVGTVALQRKVGNDWQTLGAYYSKMLPQDRLQQDGLTIHGVFYLNQDDKIRVAAYNRTGNLLAPRIASGNVFSDPPFVSENHYLTIYLLSAADAPPPQ